MRFESLNIALFLLACPACLWGAAVSSALQRPIIGYALQQSPIELRPIFGVPGAAVYGDPLSIPVNTARLSLAPGQRYAIIERAEGSPAVLLLNGMDTREVVSIPGAVHTFDFVSFSPSGSSAVFVSQASSRVEIITGLPQTPQILQDIDLGTLPALPRFAGISDNAGTVLFSSEGAVYLLLADGSTSMVLSVAKASSIAFLPASMTAIIGDPGTGSLYVFQRPASGVMTRLLASGLSNQQQLAASGDGQTIFVTDTGSQHFWSVDVTSGTISQFDLQATVTSLNRLRNSDTFLVSSGFKQPGWMFFREGDVVRTVFVPAVQPYGLMERRPEGHGHVTGTTGLASDSANFTGLVETANRRIGLAIMPTSLPKGTVNAGYSPFRLQTNEGTPPYFWSATPLPGGLNLNSAGLLNGTPTTPGEYDVTVYVKDSSTPPRGGSATYSLAVNLPAPAFALSTSSQPTRITDQPSLTLGLSQAYPVALQAYLTLSFTPSAAGLPSSSYWPSGTYPGAALQFASGGTSASITIEPNTSSISLPSIQIGDVAGVITVTLTRVQVAGAQDLELPNPLPSTTIAVPLLAPIIAPGSLQITNVTSSGFTVELVASSTPRDLTSISLGFSSAGSTQVKGANVTVPLANSAMEWFGSANGQAAGGAFDLQIPFPFSGDPSAIGSLSVSAILTNSAGTSIPVSGGISGGGGLAGGICPTFIQAPSLQRSERSVKKANGLLARIAVPVDGALLRSDIPFFGEAGGIGFKEYRVEYGEGSNPTKWTLIQSSTTPQATNTVGLTDIQSMQGDMDLRGNLATWNTGLKEWVHLPWHPADDPTDLRGTYTVRLIVTSKDGKSVEDRITIEVGRVISQVLPGDAISTDNKVMMHFEPQSLQAPFRVYTIKPLLADVPDLPAGLRLVGSVYTIREPGDQFLKPVTLRFDLAGIVPSRDFSQCSIYAYNGVSRRWEPLVTSNGSRQNSLETSIYMLQDPWAYFAVLQGPRNQSVPPTQLNIDPTQSPVSQESAVLVSNSFETDAGEWADRDRGFGGTVTRDRTATPDGTFSLKIANQNAGGDFAVTVVSSSFQADTYPIISFDYRIGPGIKTDFYARVGRIWYRVGFTGDESELRNTDVGISSIGRIEGIIPDGKWHSAAFDLNRMLASKTGRRKVEEIILADWHVGGYMKLEFGNNPRGASFHIDNFKIRRGEETVATNNNRPNLLLIDDFDGSMRFNSLGGAYDVFSDPGTSNVSIVRTIAGISATGSENRVLSLKYDVTRVGAYGGYWTQLRGAPGDDFDQISLRVKPVEGFAPFLVGLKRKDGIEVKVPSERYWGPATTDGWRQVAIPLASFGLSTELSALDMLSLSFTNAAGHSRGEILVDDVRLERGLQSVLIADFEGDSNTNRLMQKNWVFTRGASALGVGLQRPESERASQSLRISYGGTIGLDLGSGDFSYAGWVAGLGGINAIGVQSIQFRIRGQVGGERFNLYLDDGTTRRPVDSAKYFAITRAWKDVSIPLDVFAKQGIDLSHLDELQFVFEWQQMSGTVYLDDVRLTKSGSASGDSNMAEHEH